MRRYKTATQPPGLRKVHANLLDSGWRCQAKAFMWERGLNYGVCGQHAVLHCAKCGWRFEECAGQDKGRVVCKYTTCDLRLLARPTTWASLRSPPTLALQTNSRFHTSPTPALRERLAAHPCTIVSVPLPLRRRGRCCLPTLTLLTPAPNTAGPSLHFATPV